jgi:hypothetical protein
VAIELVALLCTGLFAGAAVWKLTLSFLKRHLGESR